MSTNVLLLCDCTCCWINFFITDFRNDSFKHIINFINLFTLRTTLILLTNTIILVDIDNVRGLCLVVGAGAFLFFLPCSLPLGGAAALKVDGPPPSSTTNPHPHCSLIVNATLSSLPPSYSMFPLYLLTPIAHHCCCRCRPCCHCHSPHCLCRPPHRHSFYQKQGLIQIIYSSSIIIIYWLDSNYCAQSENNKQIT